MKTPEEFFAQKYAVLDEFGYDQGLMCIKEYNADLLAKVSEQEREIADLKENYEGMKSHCKYLTEINVFNEAFEKSDEQWRRQHHVAEGESFTDWYMKYHAAEREADRKQVSEQSQSIEALTKENEQMKQMMDVEHCPSLETCCKEATELSRFREERKELVEAINKRIYKYGVTLPASEKYFLRSLLSKFEVPNTTLTKEQMRQQDDLSEQREEYD